MSWYELIVSGWNLDWETEAELDLISWNLVTRVIDHTQDDKQREKQGSGCKKQKNSAFSAGPAACGSHDRYNRETSNLSLRNHKKESTRPPAAR